MGVEIKSQPAWAADVEELKLPVSRAEIDARRDAFLEGMRREGIDVAVVTTPQSLSYLTGIEFGFSFGYPLVVDTSGNHRVLLRAIDKNWEDVWAPLSWVTSWQPHRDQDDIDELIAQAIPEIHSGEIRRIGFELDRPSVSYATVTHVSKALGAEPVSINPIIDYLRVVKSDAELDLIRRAGVISGKAADAVVEAIKSGATDTEAVIEAEKVIIRNGQHGPWEPFVFTGASGGTGHIPFVRKAPEPGEPVSFYVSGHVHGYANPIERTLVRNPDTRGILDLVDAVATATETLMAEIRPGMTSDDVYHIAHRSHTARGVAEHWRNHAGYAVGIKWSEFELFRFRDTDQRVVRAGTTMHLVPCLTIPDITNICASKTIVVTDKGGLPLNDYPLRLPAF